MRTFISIGLPLEITKEIKKIQETLPDFEGKKTEMQNLHLTLKFLGEIDEEKLERIKIKLNEVKVSSFEAELNKIGVFSENFIRIIWVSINGCKELQEKIDNSLQEFFKKEERFMGHLTLARVKNVDDKIKFIQKLEKIPLSKISFRVEEFFLMKSELTKKGPLYSVLEKYPLKK